MDIKNLCSDFYIRAAEIPFGNSDFQADHLIIGQAETPERAYRQILLEMNSLIDALQEAHFKRREQNVDILELEDTKRLAVGYEYERTLIEIERATLGLAKSEKLIKDALHSLALYNARLEKFPKYTREQFEAAEGEHFEALLTGSKTKQGQLDKMRGGLKTLFSRVKESRLLSNG